MKVESVVNSDFRYRMDYDITGYNDCEEYGCNDEGICRCYTITEVTINEESINLMEITDTIYKSLIDGKNDLSYIREKSINQLLGDDEYDLNKYFINRLLTIHKYYLSENWNPEWSHDYYGQEVDSITLENRLEFRQSLLHINDCNKDKIEHLLIEEYGHLSDKLKNKKWKVDLINKDQLSFGSKDHYNNVETGLMYYNEKEYILPKGVVLEDVDGMYRVFDGYHRLKNTTSDVVEVIIAY